MAGFIRLSPDLISAVTRKFIMNGQYGGNGGVRIGLLGRHLSSTGEVGSRLFIMKGTVPSDFSTLTSFNARAADMLITYDATDFTSGGVVYFTPTQDTVNPVIISTLYRNAENSGTATWFWWLTTPLASSNTFSNATLPLNQVFGTIGVTGSGADLEYTTTNIVAGEQYRIFNLRLQLPESWSW